MPKAKTPKKPTTKTSTQRFVFRQDDDSHWFLLPLEKVDKFDRWLEYVYGDGDVKFEGEDFNKYMTGRAVSYFSFTDPQPE
jgi:hypothetical protein